MDEKDIQQENGAEQEPLNEEQAETQNAENAEAETLEAEAAGLNIDGSGNNLEEEYDFSMWMNGSAGEETSPALYYFPIFL